MITDRILRDDHRALAPGEHGSELVDRARSDQRRRTTRSPRSTVTPPHDARSAVAANCDETASAACAGVRPSVSTVACAAASYAGRRSASSRRERAGLVAARAAVAELAVADALRELLDRRVQPRRRNPRRAIAGGCRRRAPRRHPPQSPPAPAPRTRRPRRCAPTRGNAASPSRANTSDDRRARDRLDDRVGIDERPLQALRAALADRRLPRAHHPDEHEVAHVSRPPHDRLAT